MQMDVRLQPLSVTITQPAAVLSATLTSQVNVLCFGGATGSVVITPSGGTSPYTITPAQTALTAGAKTFTVTDANGCTTTVNATITQPASLPTVVLTSQTNVLCRGNSTGAINITASGGTGAYTYDWADVSGATNVEDRTGLPAGTYTVTVTDANGCSTAPLSVTITQPAAVLSAALTSQVNVLCFGGATGSVVITPSGGTSPYTITPAQTGLTAGAKTFTVTDANGCTTTVNATITQPASLPTVVLTSQTNVLCRGNSTGAINITASGGTGAYTYDWADVAGTSNTEDRTALAAGTYSVTVTDANGCSTAPLSVTITQPAAVLSATLTSQVNVLCFGAATGSVVITPSGGTSPYTITPAQTGLTAGAKTFTVTDANGCTTTVNATITQPASLPTVVLTSQTNVLCRGNSTGAINITASGGTGAFTYDWADVAGTSNTEDRTALVAGTYTITVTDANGCSTAPLSVTITQPAAALARSLTQTNILCFGNSTGAIDLTVTGGTSPYTYLWSNAATTQDLTGLAAGTYSVTITDANSCTHTISTTITQPTAALARSLTQTNVLCFGNSTGAIDLTVTGGTSPYTYAWSNAATTQDLTGLAAGTYSVTITDANSCTQTISTTITQPTAALARSLTQTNVLCFGNSTGAIDLTVSGGTSPYTYAWSNAATTQDLTGLAAGTYSVTITDANSCTHTISTIITQPTAALARSLTQTNVLCFGNSTGAIDLTVTGGTSPYTYAWSNAATTQDLTGLAAGTYSVTITDANSCTQTISTTITQPTAALARSLTQTNVLCFGNSTGAIDLTVSGGTSPYTYAWSNAATTQDLTGLTAGAYSVTITDANGCTQTISTTITQPTASLARSLTQTNCLVFWKQHRSNRLDGKWWNKSLHVCLEQCSYDPRFNRINSGYLFSNDYRCQ